MTHNGKSLLVSFAKYQNGQRAIKLYDLSNRELYAVASVAIPISLKEDEIAIKNYSENEGILDALIRVGVIHEPHRYFSSGFVQIPICKLTPAYHEAYSMESGGYPFTDGREFRSSESTVEN